MRKPEKGRSAVKEENTCAELRQIALASRQKAYSPYSHFSVGAALLSADGRVFTGSNVENASYGLTVCAERVAFFKAVTEGCREFRTLAVAGSGPDPAIPCGACLQVMAEFAPGLKIILVHDNGEYLCYSLKDFLPVPFRLEGAPGM